MNKLLAIVLMAVLCPLAVDAAVILVDSPEELVASRGAEKRSGANVCRLREAIIAANKNVSVGGCVAGDTNGIDEIQLAVNQPILLEEPIYILSALKIRTADGFERVHITSAEKAFDGPILDINQVTNFYLDNVKITGARNSRMGGAVVFNAPVERNLDSESFGSVATISINNSHFEDNQAAEGGAVWISETFVQNAQIINNTFVNNQSVGSGGAIWGELVTSPFSLRGDQEFDFLIAGNRFENNTAGANAGAVYVANSGIGVRIKNNSFTNNSSANEAGALMLFSSFGERRQTHAELKGDIFESYQVFGNSFFNNYAQVSGGALFKGSTANVQLINNTFAFNEALNFGGAMTLIDAQSALFHNTFVNNSSDNGGHVYSVDTIMDMQNNLLVGAGLKGTCDDLNSTFLTVSNNAIDGMSCDYLNNPEANTLIGSDFLAGFSIQGGIKAFRPAPDSPIIDYIAMSECLSFNDEIMQDQWGQTRPTDGGGDLAEACDVGAVEAIDGSDLIWFNGF